MVNLDAKAERLFLFLRQAKAVFHVKAGGSLAIITATLLVAVIGAAIYFIFK